MRSARDQAVAALGAHGRLDRVAEVAEPLDVPAHGPRADLEPPGELAARPLPRRLQEGQQCEESAGAHSVENAIDLGQDLTYLVASVALMKKLTWAQVCARRLARHGLTTPLPGGPADVVAAVAGTHAQVLSAAELSIALRLDGATRQTVQDALWETRDLVKMFGPRGTVHLLPHA